MGPLKAYLPEGDETGFDAFRDLGLRVHDDRAYRLHLGKISAMVLPDPSWMVEYYHVRKNAVP